MPVKTDGNWGFMARNRVRLSYCLATLLLLTCIFMGREPAAIHSIAGIIAAVIMFCGVALRGWSAGVIHKDQQLATAGPYALCRHPLYFGSWLMLTGFLLMLGGWWIALAFALAMGVLYWPTLRNEEAVLADTFPQQWTAYCQQTGRLWPKQWPKLRAHWAFQQWRANRDYETGLLALLAITALQLVRWLA